MEVSNLAYLLLSNLIASSPKRTRALADNITMKELEDRYVITISNGVPYARNTNYNWGNRTGKSKADYEARGLHKEKENYLWVERTIEQTMSSIVGRSNLDGV